MHHSETDAKWQKNKGVMLTDHHGSLNQWLVSEATR